MTSADKPAVVFNIHDPVKTTPQRLAARNIWVLFTERLVRGDEDEVGAPGDETSFDRDVDRVSI